MATKTGMDSGQRKKMAKVEDGGVGYETERTEREGQENNGERRHRKAGGNRRGRSAKGEKAGQVGDGGRPPLTHAVMMGERVRTRGKAEHSKLLESKEKMGKEVTTRAGGGATRRKSVLDGANSTSL